MGITLRSNVDASAYASKALTAVSRGLSGIFFFDTSIEKAKNDFGISSNAMASVVGAPNVMPDRTQFLVGQNYIQTDIAETNDVTFAIVLRSLYSNADMIADAGKRPFSCGNYGPIAGSYEGLAIGFASPGTGRMSFGRVLNDGTTSALQAVTLGASLDPMQWRLVTGTFNSSTGVISVRNETNGEIGTRGGAGYTSVKSSRPISIGYAVASSSHAGPVQVSQLRLYSTVLTTEELATVAAEMRKYEAGHNGRVV